MPADEMGAGQKVNQSGATAGTVEDHCLPSATGTISRLAYARAKAAGLAPDLLLKRAGLTRSQIENGHARLPVIHQIRFLNLVASAQQDDFLGFNLAQVPDLREFGLFYYVLASAETLTEALKRATRYSSMLNDGVVSTCTIGTHMTLSLHYVGVNRQEDRHQIEFWMAAILRICCQLTRRELRPLWVRMIHHRSTVTPEFLKFFGGNVQFGSTVDEMTFSTAVSELPVVSADPYLNRILVAFCEEALSKRTDPRGSFRSTVENAVAPVLPHGKPQAADIARRLGLGQRTLARRLEAEGLTFSGLMENLKFDLAKRYLADRNLSISEIAWLLGYKEIASFSHAFRHWSGETPREARARATGVFSPHAPG